MGIDSAMVPGRDPQIPQDLFAENPQGVGVLVCLAPQRSRLCGFATGSAANALRGVFPVLGQMATVQVDLAVVRDRLGDVVVLRQPAVRAPVTAALGELLAGLAERPDARLHA